MIAASAVRLPFGKHKGARLSDVGEGYLAWLAGRDGLQPWFRRAVAKELERRAEPPTANRSHRASGSPVADDLPLGDPGLYAGVELNAVHAGTFREAVRRGAFYAEPSEPIASPALRAWERWERMAGREPRVVRITWQEWEAGVRPPDEAEEAPF